MNCHFARAIVALLGLFGGLGLCQAADTIDQAEELSQRTGRPILAVAGSKT